MTTAGPNSGEFVPFDVLLEKKGNHQSLDPYRKVKKDCEEQLRQAAATLEAARQQAAAIEEEAYNKGFARGEEAGTAQAQTKFDQAVAAIEQLMVALTEQRLEVQQHYEGEMLLLIKAVADRLVHHELTVNPKVIEGCLRQAMQFVADSSVVRVRLHPDDFAHIREAALADGSVLQQAQRLDLIEDKTVHRGGCLISSDFGEIDATVDAFRKRLYKAVDQAFLAALENQQEEQP